MIKHLVVFVLLILMVSCKKDADIDIGMTDEQIVALLQDMHVANAAVLKYKKDSRDSVVQIFKSEMANIHKVSEERIDFVMEQIQRSPKKYLELEKQAVQNLKTLKDSLKTTPVIKTETTKPKKEKKR